MEREPKTLSLGEFNYARVSKAQSQIDLRTDVPFRLHSILIVCLLQEAALHVLTTHSWQDAARIFTEVTYILLCW